MRRCSVRPYEGNEGFIFVSYCYLDKIEIFPLIERLARDGYRVWYDEGVSEYSGTAEVIADRLSRCSVCLTFVTENAMNSHNYRREVNFALLKSKPLIAVMMQEVSLSPGMGRQLSLAALTIHRQMLTDDAFFFELYRSPLLDATLGDLNNATEVNEWSDEPEYLDDNYVDPRSFNDIWFSDLDSEAHYTGRRVNATYRPDPLTIDRVTVDRLTAEREAAPQPSATLHSLNMVRDDDRRMPVKSIKQQNGRWKKLWLIPIIAAALILIAAAAAIIMASRKGGDEPPPPVRIVTETERIATPDQARAEKSAD